MEQFFMGVAERDITPAVPIETIGFGRADNMARGILHKLSAQAAVFKSGASWGCLITIDHIGFLRRHADDLRTEIGQILSIDKEKVMLCFSHCHSSPNESAAPQYKRFVCEQVKDAAICASKNMAPVKAAWGNAYTEIGVNRRKDCSALDRRIGILKICDADDGEPSLLILRLTAHTNVLKEDNYMISPDFFGAVRDVFAEKYGCPIMVTQGAAGNVAPKYFDSAVNPPDANDQRFIRTKKALERMAQTVLNDAGPVIGSLCPKEIYGFSMYAREIALAADVPPYPQALKIADDAKRYCGIDGTGWLAEVRALNERNIRRQTEMVEAQYFVLNEGCFCGVPHEIMVELALDTSRMLKNEFFYFGGYTNGCAGYLPTEEAFDEGGYEVYWSMLFYYMYYGRVFPLQRDSASKLTRFVAEHYHRTSKPPLLGSN